MSFAPQPVEPPSHDQGSRPHHHHKRRRRRRSSSSLTRRAVFALPTHSDHPADIAIEALLAILLAFAPFAYGSVEGWSQLIVYSLIALICVCFSAKILLARNEQVVRSFAYIPIAL